jgi:hypothetical protein
MKEMSLKNRKDAIGGAVKRVFILVIIAVFAVSNQVNAQSGKSNGKLEIIKVSVPDSVVFTVANGEKVKKVVVSLVKGEQTTGSEVYISGAVTYRNGGMIFTNESVLTAKFKTPVDFEAQKIGFKVDDGAVTYYNVAESKWKKK